MPLDAGDMGERDRQSQLRNLTDAKKACARELRKLRRRCRLQRMPARRDAWQIATALLTAEDTGCEDAVAYLSNRPRALKVSLQTATSELQKLQTTLTTRHSGEGRGCEGYPVKGRYKCDAQKYRSEAALHAWIQKQNLEKGEAPATLITLSHVRTVGAGTRPRDPHVGFSNRSLKGQRQWLRRWCRRWSVGLGKIAARQHMPAQVTKEKVSRGQCRPGPSTVPIYIFCT